MSLRRKLTLFFIAAVAIPVTLLAVLVVWINGESSAKQADAQLQASLETATSVYHEAQRAAPGEAQRIAGLAEPDIESGDRRALQALAEKETSDPEIAAVTILDADGKALASAGPKQTLASGTSQVRGPDGRPIGTVEVGILSTKSYLNKVESLTAGDAGLVESDAVVGTTVPLEPSDIPDSAAGPFDVETPDETARAATAGLPGEAGTRVVLIATASSEPLGSAPLMAAALLVFLLFALLMLFMLLRGLRGRLAGMLEGARRIGSGDYEQSIPLEGDDELTDLAREINRMSTQISSQVDELGHQRRRIDESVRRLGDAFASGLDRQALLAVAIETVVEACNADCGRVVLPDADGTKRTLTTADPARLGPILDRAIADATGRPRPAIVNSANYHAMAQAMMDGEGPEKVLCTIAVARSGPAFSAAEAQVLSYLIGQIRTSIENIELHEVVARQAVTDDLTGISNHRHFIDWIEHEIARMGRFAGNVSLVMLDIDDFKAINDTRGHLNGDLVLVAIADVLREESREIDEVARFGGEEFVVGLPGTTQAGAAELAERLRRRIEAVDVPAEDEGGPIAVTASFGIATAPADGSTERQLIAAADRALYEAKRRGKNRVEAAPGGDGETAQGN